MPSLGHSKTIHWTYHARDKMRFYKLSEQRVRSVIHSPKRVEEGIAPKTIAMMQPSSIKSARGKQSWSQEIWVMVEEGGAKSQGRITKVISAWRYPGVTKPRSETTKDFLRQRYQEYSLRG